jgi:hypothetical protein
MTLPRPFSILIAISFLILISTPMMVNITEHLTGSSLDISSTENRTLAERPTPADAASWRDFTGQFDDYYQDTFVLRNRLLRLWLRLRLVLGVSPTDKVLIGNDGWLYFTGDQVIEDVEARRPLLPEELEEQRRYLEAKRDWLRSEGIEYLYVIAPNKHSIYPEHLPVSVTASRRATRADQLVDYLEEHASVEVLDLRSTLRRAKDSGRLFHKTDTHWNTIGAHFAHQAIIERLHHTLPLSPVPGISEEEVISRLARPGDLARLTGFPDEFSETRYRLPKRVHCQPAEEPRIEPDVWMQGSRYRSVTCDTDTKVELLFLHDSFQMALLPQLSQSFARTDAINTPFRPQEVRTFIEQYKPAVIIEESVERLIAKPAKTDLINAFILEKHFAEQPLLNTLDNYHSNPIIESASQVDVSFNEGGALFTTQDRQSYVLIGWDGNHDRVGVRLRFHSPEETLLRLFFRSESQPRYGQLAPYVHKVSEGWNDIYIPVRAEGLRSPLRLTPGIAANSYQFELIEIRQNNLPTDD